jgi:hypothetical protein
MMKVCRKVMSVYAALILAMAGQAQNSNDQCSGAISLTAGGAQYCMTPLSANTTTNDPSTTPSCWSSANNDGVWFSFNATATSAVIGLTDNGNTYTPMIAVFNGGASPGTCPSSAATAMSGGCLDFTTDESQLNVTGLTVGNTYYILVDQFSTIVTSFCIQVTNAPATTSATAGGCPAAINTTVTAVTCSQVGTGAMNNSAGVVTYNNAVGAGTIPSPAPSCGGGGTTCGVWAHYDLNGATDLTFNWESAAGGSGASGAHNIYAAFYQGASCASLTQVSCQMAAYFSAGTLYVNNLIVTGLNASQDLWVYMWDDGCKAFTLPYDVTGAAAIPSNDVCSGAPVGSTSGCNLGALGDTPWSGPSAQGYTCTGGNWSSNENTVWYAFTTTATTATVGVSGLTCNDGSSGTAQFAAFSNCSCPTTYTANYTAQSCFLGCAVGAGSLNLASLTTGQTIYIAVDGTAGDVCAWNWTVTNLTLPVGILGFKAECKEGEVIASWETATESNSGYFTLERSFDGVDFQPVATVPAARNSSSLKRYSATDKKTTGFVTYYRLSETDLNGEVHTFNTVQVSGGCSREEFKAFAHGSTIHILSNLEDEAGVCHVNLYNAMGARVAVVEKQFEEGSNETSFSVDLASGVYFLVIDKGGKVYRDKVFIHK